MGRAGIRLRRNRPNGKDRAVFAKNGRANRTTGSKRQSHRSPTGWRTLRLFDQLRIEQSAIPCHCWRRVDAGGHENRRGRDRRSHRRRGLVQHKRQTRRSRGPRLLVLSSFYRVCWCSSGTACGNTGEISSFRSSDTIPAATRDFRKLAHCRSALFTWGRRPASPPPAPSQPPSPPARDNHRAASGRIRQ